MVKGIMVGFVLGAAALVGLGFCYFAGGMAPAATTDPPMPFEKKLANLALDAHIERQHTAESPVSPDEATLLRALASTNSTALVVTDFLRSHQTMRKPCIPSRPSYLLARA